MSKHTPGPWNRRVDETGSVIRIEQAGTGGSILVGYATSFSMKQIASGEHSPDGGLAYANARLIAAAPELLEALKFYVEAMEAIGQDVDYGREIIAKAEGR